MKRVIFTFVGLFILSITTGCSSVPRTKWTDPVMRVFIDPSIEANMYVKIRSALVKSKKWIVVGRKGDFEAALREQDLLHKKVGFTDRFANQEKYAWIGELRGARGAVMAEQTCTRVNTWTGWDTKCEQHLAIMDVNTGVIIAVADVVVSESGNLRPAWTEVVEMLNDAYPEHYEDSKEHQILTDYKDESEVRSVHQKEKLAREVIEKRRIQRSINELK